MSTMYLKANNGNTLLFVDTDLVVDYDMPNGDTFTIRERDINNKKIVNVKIIDASEFAKFNDLMESVR